MHVFLYLAHWKDSFDMQHNFGANRGLMVESQTHNWKVASSNLGPVGIVGGGSECTALSPPSIPRRGVLEQGTEPPTAPRAPQHKWLPAAPGVCSQCVCVSPLLCVCTLDGLNAEHKFRVWVTHHTWPFVTSLSLSSWFVIVLNEIQLDENSMPWFCSKNVFIFIYLNCLSFKFYSCHGAKHYSHIISSYYVKTYSNYLLI